MTTQDPMGTSSTANPPGQPQLRRRVDTHAGALARMRADLADPRHDLGLRSLAAQGSDETAIALLDTWAVVADVVAFYSERIATEGFLRTATELRSVRELARTLGHALRPGVAAQADLVFTVETAPGTPEVVTIAAGTPVQSVPGPAQVPQTFETSVELEVRGVWNSLAVLDSTPQNLPRGAEILWLRGTTGTVKPGDSLLIRGVRTSFGDDEQRQVRRVTSVALAPDGLAGWVEVTLDVGIGVVGPGFPAVLDDIKVDGFSTRARLFGWNAPDPNLLVVDSQPPPLTEDPDADGIYAWAGYGVDSTLELELDGEHPGVLPGSWLVLAQGEDREAFEVIDAVPDGATKWTLSGPTTLVTLDPETGSASAERQRARVLCASTPLPAAEVPDERALAGRLVTVTATDPPLPPERRVLLRGTDFDTRVTAVEPATVLTCTLDEGGATMTLELTADLSRPFVRQGLQVLANVAGAAHGETVQQVLGSGDGRTSFATFRPRRGPLTYVRDTSPDGARAELTVRVDGVAWTEVTSLDDAGPDEGVYAVQQEDDPAGVARVRIVTGDGVHGARPPSGPENVTATYRVGIGADGAVGADHLTLLPRRPFGVRAVTNPSPTLDWAPPETIEEARLTAPLRVRTLGRAVSVADHEDLARGYAGVGPVRADLVWDGRAQRVLVSLLATAATAPSAGLVTDLRATLEAARDPGCPLDVLAGEPTWFGVRVDLAHDPAYERDTVLASVQAALATTFDAAVRPFATSVTSSAVLVVVRGVSGVAACTMPRLLPVAGLAAPPLPPVLPPDEEAREVLVALPGRWDGVPLPAQLLGLAPGGVEIGEMAP